ncbi:glycosyltransferase [Rhabdobacter roseus]|uniref:Glycosyltransferase n=1 Tax=Rhabdobacter roseus TaxID=1655419 RepID=A0A840TRQ8_9BACT|nr:glycosyltransferase [Rhabdobacter roseus]MBB5284242.1 hypothetical protein [Rhabdobacter roseus]
MDSKRNKILIIAPHLRYPCRNGADILIDKLSVHISANVECVDLISEKEVYRFTEKQKKLINLFNNSIRSRHYASIRTLFFKSHYLKEKFITINFTKELKNILNNYDYDFIFISYIITAEIVLNHNLNLNKDKLYIITHNDEVKWFRDIYSSTNNFLLKRISKLSWQWIIKFLTSNINKFTLLHVSTTDRNSYLSYFPSHTSHLIRIGTEQEQLCSTTDNSDQIVKLIFIGSLNVKMNLDALLWFSKRFFPTLQSEFGKKLKITIVGSNPNNKIISLCQTFDWHLYPNVSDEELNRLLQASDFSILPFQYSTGAKLKQTKSISNGIPYLSTETIQALDEPLPPYCLNSNLPNEWVRHINNIKYKNSKSKILNTLIDFSKNISWEISISNLYKEISSNIE